VIKQRTLELPVTFGGVGLHTGVDGSTTVHPAKIGTGLEFSLGTVTFPAHAEYVVETRRATVLGRDGATASTVEHLLSALFVAGITNATIEVRGPEIPILDGSAAAFLAEFARVGTVAQDAPRAELRLDRPHVFRDGDGYLVLAPADAFRVRFAVDFAPPVGAQFIDARVELESYTREIAAARTFGYLHEVEALLAAGLARGGSLDNALVYGPEGALAPERWPNEVVRHKVLDLVGDFALLGAWPLADVVSIKSGHRLHALATRALRADLGASSAVALHA